jgi:hydrogenase nickel incorporation protein HypA/HybF
MFQGTECRIDAHDQYRVPGRRTGLLSDQGTTMSIEVITMPAHVAVSQHAGPFEGALCRAIIQAALSLADGREVTGIQVRVGGHPADPELMSCCIQEAAAGTAAEHAVIELIMDPPAVRCLACGNEVAAGYALALLTCRRCGSFDIEASGTEQLTLESIAFRE